MAGEFTKPGDDWNRGACDNYCLNGMGFTGGGRGSANYATRPYDCGYTSNGYNNNNNNNN